MKVFKRSGSATQSCWLTLPEARCYLHGTAGDSKTNKSWQSPFLQCTAQTLRDAKCLLWGAKCHQLPLTLMDRRMLNTLNGSTFKSHSDLQQCVYLPSFNIIKLQTINIPQNILCKGQTGDRMSIFSPPASTEMCWEDMGSWERLNRKVVSYESAVRCKWMHHNHSWPLGQDTLLPEAGVFCFVFSIFITAA